MIVSKKKVKIMHLTATILALVSLLKSSCVLAWASQRFSRSSLTTFQKTNHDHGVWSQDAATPRFQIYMSESSDAVAPEEELTEEEWSIVKCLHDKASNGSLKDLLFQELPTMNPRLIMKLRQGSNDSRPEFQNVSEALNDALDARLMGAYNALDELLAAGEIRKLDALIGKNAREGKLDVAFFQVLNMNLQDAAKYQDDAEGANRFSILKHIYTRCQEEAEKTSPPGVALLNKVMRTEVNSIRQNQLYHYLCPQPTTIKTPDGKELELRGTGQEMALVPHAEFIEALANAVNQIRIVEQAGAADRASTANMVESCRQIAIEARVVIGQHYGVESEELREFESGLLPVFRDSSPESPYIIKGV
jgi:hypothetical protein